MKRRTNSANRTTNLSQLNERQIEQLVRVKTKQALDDAMRGGQLVQIIEQTIVQSSSYSGPTPPADECAKFEAICPGFTMSWVEMAKKGQSADIATIIRRDRFTIVYKVLSLIAAFLLAVLLMGGGIWLLYLGKSVAGFAAIGAAIVAVVGSILYSKPATSNVAPEPTPPSNRERK